MDDPAVRRREALVNALWREGTVHDPAVRQALLAVPRERFLPGLDLDEAYRNAAVPTHRGEHGEVVSSCSQPSMVALMLEQLGAAPGERVLEIGAGTGYNAALLAHLVGPEGRVVTLDVDTAICAEAAANLRAASARARVVVGDGREGWPEEAPYDRIIVTAAAEDVPAAWWAQLATGGRLVVPLRLGPGAEASVAFEHATPPWPAAAALRARSRLPCRFLALRGAEATGPPEERGLGPLLSSDRELWAVPDGAFQAPARAVVVHRRDTAFVSLPADPDGAPLSLR